MKATHIFAGQFPVAVEDVPGKPEVARITYVGPNVPGNRKRGDRRLASRTNLFTGQPTLAPIPPPQGE